MAAKGDDRIAAATFFTTQVDFSDPGDLKIFADEDRIKNIESEMQMSGYLDSSSMANTFNMLRPNEMIWSYVVNNYLKGVEPMAFDLLAWNSNSTRMPRANHSFYLRNCYLNNQLAKKKMKLGDVTLDLGEIKIPVYNLAAKEDHIAPARSVFNGAKLFGGEMRYVLGGSGHIAGVINPPATKAQIPILDRPAPFGNFQGLGGQGRGASRLVVAGLDRMDRRPVARKKFRRESRAAERSRFSATPPENMSGRSPDAGRRGAVLAPFPAVRPDASQKGPSSGFLSPGVSHIGTGVQKWLGS